MRWIQELARRKVLKVGAVYLATAWLLLQLTDIVAPALELPSWTLKFVLLLLILGFPLAIILAWQFNLTENGLQAESSVSTLRRGAWAPGVALLALALIGGLLFVSRPGGSGSDATLVSVAAVDGGESAGSLAKDLFVKLGSLQASTVNALQMIEPGSSRQADLLFKVGGSDVGGEPRANLTLIDNRTSTLLWAREFVQPGGNQADLRQQLGYSAARVLHCATEALSPQHPKLAQPTLRLYLNGCADLANLLAQDPQLVIASFKQVTEQAPSFAGAWAKLLLAQIDAVRSKGTTYGALSGEMQAHIGAARKLDPGMAEAYLAESWIQAPRPIIGWMRFTDEAVARHPNHAEALEMHALGVSHVGRMREAVDDARRAAQVDPLSPSARNALITALMDSGAIEAARNELRETERLWPGATNVIYSRFILESRYGDPGEALRILESGHLGSSQTPGIESFLKARMDPSPAKIERAIADTRGTFGLHVEVLAAFGRNTDLVTTLLSADPNIAPGAIVALFRPAFATLHRDPRFMVIADRFGVLAYWRETGKWPDFCSRADLPYDCRTEAAKLLP